MVFLWSCTLRSLKLLTSERQSNLFFNLQRVRVGSLDFVKMGDLHFHLVLIDPADRCLNMRKTIGRAQKLEDRDILLFSRAKY